MKYLFLCMYLLEYFLAFIYKYYPCAFSYTKLCGATTLQAHFLWASQNILWGSNLGSNDNKNMTNYFLCTSIIKSTNGPNVMYMNPYLEK